ncbi:MAG: chalcone isomerase family protein, partial [Desulfobacteraceae bacterium]|nr:chalcone isomerase family protein [Desulfobacteraceae bacterium]
KANPPELVEAQADNMALFASWLDEDMFDGAISETTYIPGQGLTLRINGKERGTISDEQFIEMYYRYQVGEGANKSLREGYLGQ